MTPLERLLAEELPTGYFGSPPRLLEPTSLEDAAAHCAELAAALDGVTVDRDARRLYAVPEPAVRTNFGPGHPHQPAEGAA